MKEVAENRRLKKGDSRQISPNDRCRHVREDGKRCRQKAWRGKKVCYQHDPEMAELRRSAGRPQDLGRLATVVGVRRRALRLRFRRKRHKRQRRKGKSPRRMTAGESRW